MRYLQLLNGDKIPALGLGTYLSPPDQVERAILSALDAGYRHIDCASIYGNEREIGVALRKAFKQYPREELWITSKLWCDAHKPDDVLPALTRTLENLGLDYLDLYLIHWPVALKSGVDFPQKPDDYLTLEEVPLRDTWRAMEHCADKEIVRNIGVSNFSIKKLTALLRIAAIPPAVNQIEMHPYQQQQAQVAFARKHNIILTAYRPLASIGTPIKTTDGCNPPPLLNHPLIMTIASKHNCTTAQVLLAWLLQQGVVAIPKSVHPERIQENFKALDVCLDRNDMIAIKELDIGARIIDGTTFTGHNSPYTLENIWDGEC
ncbi:aldo/keto reductase [Halodesulfovibrio marinisediminis]|uniref:Alcohol dehydrogenase (NADP+) n=1 Tax=Halodesulfovibrio marinisediminis DSM 17456 TaxID=1121457 RepID=A0A1N6H3Y9_9BACT|nr:aldo/keto reductase [Halodesulfovibrio marinisediminis]SIO14494.1 alcohol dehydrogenase (NADP+) [Halodesulfovibrio marinisediminis DSM 17456]